MDRWQGRVAVVTGASGEIGTEICRSLVKAGMKVIGTSRGLSKIQTLSKELSDEPGSLHAIKCDLNNDEEILDLFHKIKNDHGGVDVCINNAGYIGPGTLLDGRPGEWRRMVNINLVALSLVTQEAIALMREKGVDDGQIIHISSLMGHKPYRGQVGQFYASTKHAVRGLTEGLRQELKCINSNIRVSSISPGLVKTQFLPRMMGSDMLFRAIDYTPIDAENVASSVVHVLTVPPNVQVHDILLQAVRAD